MLAQAGRADAPGQGEAGVAPMRMAREEGEGGIFHLEFEKMTWQEHKVRARSMGMTLASITSAEENEMAKVMVIVAGRGELWIGARRRKGKGKGPGPEHWRWMDGRPFEYTNWPPYPDNAGGREDSVRHQLESFD